MAQDAVTTTKTPKVGRPSKYKKEYCQQIIECGKRGDTLVHFACDIGVVKDTLNEWASVHPEFSDALKVCKQENEKYWINLAKNRANGQQSRGSDILIKFMLSSSHGYREKTDVVQEVTADVTTKSTVDINFVDLKP